MDLRDQLARLGLQKGTTGFQQTPRREAWEIHRLIEGEIVHTSRGSFFLAEKRYPLDHRHGLSHLEEVLGVDQSALKELLRDALGTGFDLRQAVFVDTETTGLAGGTGTYAFLVGLGFFEGDYFRVLQFFMRDYHEEPALLHHLRETFQDTPALVTFNGRTFDVPLLHTRCITARLEPIWTGIPHLDLLPPSRRLWRTRLRSCSLSSLEQNVLGVQRTSEDVPGWQIPAMYFRYVQTGDAREMERVLYHNAQDILSMVTLSHLLCKTLTGDPAANCLDAFSLARWLEERGDWEKAGALYHAALAGPLPPEERRQTLWRLSLLLKRQGQYEEARPLWESLVTDRILGLAALEELAKSEEWHAGDLEQASRWTEQGLEWARQELRGSRLCQAEADLQHRLQRLRRKAVSGQQSAIGTRSGRWGRAGLQGERGS